MNVVGYIRVSSEKQAEEGLGLEIQEKTLRSWARAHGHRIVAICRDEGVSGTKDVADRDGLAEALAIVRTRRAAGLAVVRLDRLARDLVLQEQLLAELRRMGAETFSTSAGEAGFLKDDPDDPSRALIRQVLGAVAQYERSMITLRLRSGRRRKAERGGYAGGRPRYGFRAEHRELAKEPSEQAALTRIRQLRRQEKSLREIAMVLETEGHKPKTGDRWHPEALRRIVARL